MSSAESVKKCGTCLLHPEGREGLMILERYRGRTSECPDCAGTGVERVHDPGCRFIQSILGTNAYPKQKIQTCDCRFTKKEI